MPAGLPCQAGIGAGSKRAQGLPARHPSQPKSAIVVWGSGGGIQRCMRPLWRLALACPESKADACSRFKRKHVAAVRVHGPGLARFQRIGRKSKPCQGNGAPVQRHVASHLFVRLNNLALSGDAIPECRSCVYSSSFFGDTDQYDDQSSSFRVRARDCGVRLEVRLLLRRLRERRNGTRHLRRGWGSDKFDPGR